MNLKAKLYDGMYLKPCRTYSRHALSDRPADALYRLLCSIQFARVHRYWPDFSKPKRFSEKIWSRMLHDRDQMLTTLSDKLEVRKFVQERIGNSWLIPLIWSGTDPRTIPFAELPRQFVIKATHGCGYNILVHDKSRLDVQSTIRRLDVWLKENHCLDIRLGIEWAYKNIKPAIVIEEFIGAENTAPTDYKFYCFAGRVEIVTLHFDRFTEHKTRTFDRDFQPHEFSYHFGQWPGKCERPTNFDKMVELAEKLAAGFSFMRVDLYSVGERIYFGEMTPYPGGVSTKFLPVSQDKALGAKWPAGGLRLN